MLWTLHRYVLRELIRVFLVTLLVVSVVFTLIGLIQPLRREGLVSAQKLLEVFLLTFPAVVSITLPFAALFGSTMAYGRLSEDNELEACRASGVSMRTLAMPALLLAVFAGLACFLLSNFVVGWAVQRANDFARNSFVDAAVNQLERRGRVQVGRDVTVTVEGFAYDRDLRAGRVTGLAAVQRRRGPNGEDQSVFVVAPEAILRFPEGERRVDVSLEGVTEDGDSDTQQRQIVTIEPREQRMQILRAGKTTISRMFPALRPRNIKHMSLPELAGVGVRPYEHPRVGNPLRKIRQRLAAREAMDRIAARLLPPTTDPQDSRVRPVTLRLGPASESSRQRGLQYLLTAARVQMPREQYLLRDVKVIREYDGGTSAASRARSTPPEHYKASFGVLSAVARQRSDAEDADFPRMDARLTVTLLAYSRQVPDPNDPGGRTWRDELRDGKRVDLTLDDLVLLDEVGNPVDELEIVNQSDDGALFDAVLARQAAGAKAAPAAGTVQALVDEEVFQDGRRLDDVQRLFRHKVAGEVNTRVAFAYCTVVFVLLGAAIGTIFKGGTPLKAFLISFLPWVAAMLLITFGKRLAEEAVASPMAGLTVIWMTAGGITLATSIVFAWLLRR